MITMNPKPAPALTRATRLDAAAERRFAALQAVDMFAALPEADLRKVSESLMERSYPAGSGIVHADDPAGGHFFIVAEGEVAVVLETAEGKETVLATLQPGEFFGEMSLLDEAPRAATARAVRAAKLMLLRREDFRRHVQERPAIAMSLLAELNRRLRQSNRKVAGLSYRSMQARVAGAVLGLMEEKGMRQKDSAGMRVVIRDRPTRKFLAEMAGTTRESVSRTLSAWERQGLLRTQGRDMMILEEARIKALLNLATARARRDARKGLRPDLSMPLKPKVVYTGRIWPGAHEYPGKPPFLHSPVQQCQIWPFPSQCWVSMKLPTQGAPSAAGMVCMPSIPGSGLARAITVSFDWPATSRPIGSGRTVIESPSGVVPDPAPGGWQARSPNRAVPPSQATERAWAGV